jgi:putative transposase
LGGQRGRRVSVEIKVTTLQLIDEATTGGSRHAIACEDMEIDVKTFKCWKNDTSDKRKGPLSTPGNKLSDEEVALVVKTSTSKKYMDLPPCQIVPLLAHRGKSKPATHQRPAPLVATGPNQIYSWDITFLKGPIAGRFYYLYMFMDIYGRKITGFRVHDCESMEHASYWWKISVCEREFLGITCFLTLITLVR